MKITVHRIRLNSQGYDARGRYWGQGERLYHCPEVEEARDVTWFYFREHSECRAKDVKAAREIFRSRLERMAKYPRPEAP